MQPPAVEALRGGVAVRSPVRLPGQEKSAGIGGRGKAATLIMVGREDGAGEQVQHGREGRVAEGDVCVLARQAGCGPRGTRAAAPCRGDRGGATPRAPRSTPCAGRASPRSDRRARARGRRPGRSAPRGRRRGAAERSRRRPRRR
uniref:Uncharacterized protein n=1 Tax=Setaria viridis TaxID=4556 RepID=A0A4U6T5U6_SETVI|nr:hypothetical protein SEVIR_9G472900v2 [Setaria viridis]